MIVRQFGPSGRGVVLVVGDFDGDGKDDLGVLQTRSATWYQSRSRAGDLTTQFGPKATRRVSTTPAVSDFDGDGRADAAVFDADRARWIIAQSSLVGQTRQEKLGRAGEVPLGAPNAAIARLLNGRRRGR